MEKNPNLALTVAAIVFLVVALIHLLRLILKFDIAINGQHVRLMWNALAFAVSSGLSIWLFKSRV